MTKKHSYNFIYKTTNIKNQKFYIGMHSTSDLKDGYIGSGVELRNSVRYWGKKNHKFEILEFVETREILMIRESEIVNVDLLNDPLCMNIQKGGEGAGFLNEDHMKKVCKAGNNKFKEKLKDPEYKKEFINKTEESRKRATQSWMDKLQSGEINNKTFLGKSHTEEAKKSMGEKNSELQSGESNSQFGKIWVCKHDEKVSVKINNSQLEEYLKSGWIKGRINKNHFLSPEIVLNIKSLHSQGISERKISSSVNVTRSTVSNIIRGKNYKHIGDIAQCQSNPQYLI